MKFPAPLELTNSRKQLVAFNLRFRNAHLRKQHFALIDLPYESYLKMIN